MDRNLTVRVLSKNHKENLKQSTSFIETSNTNNEKGQNEDEIARYLNATLSTSSVRSFEENKITFDPEFDRRYNTSKFTVKSLSQVFKGIQSPDASNVLQPDYIHRSVEYTPQAVDVDIDISQKQKFDKPNKLGTMFGVYLPCIQNIFGVLLFIRFTWIIGVAGVLEAFFIISLGCLTTALTAISLSAIATNGKVPGGGPYFLLSRNLGPGFGGSVGILFYMGNAVASSMYVTGAVEIFLKYVYPEAGAALFGTDRAAFANNTRVYGTVLLILMAICVQLGIKFVTYFGFIALVSVIVAIISVYIGLFASFGTWGHLPICKLGNRLLARDRLLDSSGNLQCTNERVGDMFCNASVEGPQASAGCVYFEENKPVVQRNGLPGLRDNQLKENGVKASYQKEGYIYNEKVKGSKGRGELPCTSDINSSFFILLAILFPACTGFMAGTNRSGDLKNPQESIPSGTLAAIGTTTFVYLTLTILIGATVDGELLRDKFGLSIGGGMVLGYISWPDKWVVLLGALLSTIGAGLQSLTSAPRLLQAIAQDAVFPYMSFLSKTKRGEPVYAQLLTFCITLVGVLIGDIDVITPLITQFFLMCYGFVNLATALNSILAQPSWRPTFRFYHWLLSALGVILCVVFMFISKWYYAILAVGLGIGLYMIIQFKGAKAEWGNAITGLKLTFAIQSLLKMDMEREEDRVTWRPHILCLCELDQRTLEVSRRRLLHLAGHLRSGSKGLTVAVATILGTLEEKAASCTEAMNKMREALRGANVKGISNALVAPSYAEGVRTAIMTTGLGGLRINTVLAEFPKKEFNGIWEHDQISTFMNILRTAKFCSKAVLIAKNSDELPIKRIKEDNCIDVWWLMKDGGLMLLLAFILQKSKVYGICEIRIFTFPSLAERMAADELRDTIVEYLKQMRIKASVHVIQSTIIGNTTGGITEAYEDMNQETYNQMRNDVTKNLDKKTLAKDLQELRVMPKKDIDELLRSDSSKSTLLEEENAAVASSSNTNNVRYNNAIEINYVLRTHSSNSALVIVNMPTPPKNPSVSDYTRYMVFLEALTSGIDRILLVRGIGKELITAYT